MAARDTLVSTTRALRTSAGLVTADPVLRRVIGTWGLWVGGEAAFLVLLSVSAFGRGGSTAVAVVGVARTVPAALATPVASLVADRLARGRVVLLVLVAWAVLIAAVPVVLRSASLVGLDVVVVLTGITSTALRPAVSGLVPQVADRPASLAAANSAYSLVEGLGVVVGPLLAGGLLALHLPANLSYVVVAADLALAAVVCVRIRTRHQPPDVLPGSRWQRLLEPVAGFPALIGPRHLRAVFAVFMSQCLTRGLLNVLALSIVVDLLHLGLSATGLLFAALGVGGLVGAVVTMAGATWRPALPFAAGMALWGLPLLLIAVRPAPATIWLGVAAIGLGNAVADVSGFTLVHRLVPDHLLGRAFGAFWGSAAACQALGALLGAPLIAGLGLRSALAVGGVVMTAAPLLAWHSLRTADRDLAVDEAALEALHDCPLLAPLTRVTLEQLTRSAVTLDVTQGEVVMAQGDIGRDFYVIGSGAFVADIGGDPVRRMVAGDCFGELAALSRAPRSATVTAEGPGRLLRLDGDDFVLAVTGHRSAAAATDSVVAERLAVSEARATDRRP